MNKSMKINVNIIHLTNECTPIIEKLFELFGQTLISTKNIAIAIYEKLFYNFESKDTVKILVNDYVNLFTKTNGINSMFIISLFIQSYTNFLIQIVLAYPSSRVDFMNNLDKAYMSNYPFTFGQSQHSFKNCMIIFKLKKKGICGKFFLDDETPVSNSSFFALGSTNPSAFTFDANHFGDSSRIQIKSLKTLNPYGDGLPKTNNINIQYVKTSDKPIKQSSYEASKTNIVNFQCVKTPDQPIKHTTPVIRRSTRVKRKIDFFGIKEEPTQKIAKKIE